MDFANERYVRLYVRDTLTWELIGWQGRCVLALLMRKLDRSGVLDIGDHNPDEAVAAITRLPIEIVTHGLAACLARSIFELGNGSVVMPHFLEAQDTAASDAQRAKEHRARRRDLARAATKRDGKETKRDDSVTEHDETVTRRHGASRGVTPSVPFRAVPPSPTPSGNGDRTDTIRDWYESTFLPAYPEKNRHQQVAGGLAELRKIRPDEPTRASILSHLEAWKKSGEWEKESGKYIVGPGNFFRNGCWKTMPTKPSQSWRSDPKDRRSFL